MTRRTLLTLAALLIAAAASAQKKSSSLELSFNYTKQAGPGSNQYAVWVEDSRGEVVRTLFVTSFTAKGRARSGEEVVRGYVKRPACVPAWVKRVKADSLSDAQMDAVSGATPAGGVQTFSWDFTDQNGRKVRKGTYRVCLEATLFNSSDVLYTGEFSVGDAPGEVMLTSKLTEADKDHEGMVTDVKAILK